MTTLSIPCPRCGRRYDFDAELAGAWVSCNGCDDDFQLPTSPPIEAPAAASDAPPLPAPAGRVKLACGVCNQRHEVDAAMAGRRFSCRKCGAKLKVPGSPQAPAARPVLARAPSPSPVPARPAPSPSKAPARPAPAPAATRPTSTSTPAPRPTPRAPAEVARPVATPRPEPPKPAPPVEIPLFEVVDEFLPPSDAFIEEELEETASDDLYGVDEGLPPALPRTDRPAASLGLAAGPILPPRADIRKAKAKKGKGRVGAILYAVGAIAIVLVLSFGALVIFKVRASLREMPARISANEAQFEQLHQDYLNCAHQLLDLLQTIQDAESARRVDPKCRALLVRMESSNRVSSHLLLRRETLERSKQRIESESQNEGKRLEAEFQRVLRIPGAAQALPGTFGALQSLAAFEQRHRK